MYRIGIIGCGNRLGSLLGLLEANEDMRITAVGDPDLNAMREKFALRGYMPDLYASADEMLSSEELDGVMIGTRCSLHTPMALKAAAKNVPVFLEKPVCTSWEQYYELKKLLPIADRFVVSFPLRLTNLIREVKKLLAADVIGRIEHVEAFNDVFYGRGYYKKWYRDDSETGGLFLQKATHDFDYILDLLGDEKPLRISAVSSKRVFRGDMPAGQKCSDCKMAAECPESPMNLEKAGEPANGPYCCFAVDTGNQDSGSALIEFVSGLHVVYTQDFIVRKKAGRRGARLIGYKGTLEFDFRTSEITLYSHFEDKVETFKVPNTGNHSGGDSILIDDFADLVRKEGRSHANLADGLASARLCLAARDSAEKHVIVTL